MSSRRLHPRCALVTGVQTWALPISRLSRELAGWRRKLAAEAAPARSNLSFPILEQAALAVAFAALAEARQAHAHQPVARRRRQVDAVTQRQRDRGQFLQRRGRRLGGDAAGQDAELRGLELEPHGAADTLGLAGGPPGLFGEAADVGLELAQRKVALVRVPGRDLLHRPVRLPRARVAGRPP